MANVGASNTSYVRIANSPAFAMQQFTLEAWVRRSGVGYGATTDGVGSGVVGKPNEGTVGSFLGSWYLTWSNAGRAFLSIAHTPGVDGVALQSAAVATPLARHHIAATVSADSVRLYVDGVLAAAAPWTLGTVYVGASDVLIGACNFGAGFFRRFDGTIDDVRIWNFARTANQIATSMDCRLSGNEPGLVGYYRFDASTLADDTGHGHTGTAVATPGALTFSAFVPLSSCVAGIEPEQRSTMPSFTVSPQPTRGPLRVRFAIPETGRVMISAYDVAGRLCATLASGRYEAGEHVLEGDLARAAGPGTAAGVRFVRLMYEGVTVVRTVVVVP